jgi:hypothetical protein
MPVLTGGKVIEGTIGRPILLGAAPGAGTDEIQTLTTSGTISGGTFTLTFQGQTTAAISWSATNNTLRDNVDTALEALGTIGTGGVTTAVGTMTAGIGTLTITFAGNLAKKLLSVMTATSSLTGAGAAVAVAVTTPGVDATARGAGIGQTAIDQVTGKAYINTGTALSPVWTVIGAQS